MLIVLGCLKINFPFVPNGKLIIFRCPKILANYSLTIIGFIIGIPKIVNFPFGTNGKTMVLSVQIFKHFSVCTPHFFYIVMFGAHRTTFHWK